MENHYRAVGARNNLYGKFLSMNGIVDVVGVGAGEVPLLPQLGGTGEL